MLSLNTDNKNLPIAITMGDPSGINSEIILKAFKQINNDQVHIALTLGEWKTTETVLTRVNVSAAFLFT